MPRAPAWFVWVEREVNQRAAWLRVRHAGSRAWACDVKVTIGADGRVKLTDQDVRLSGLDDQAPKPGAEVGPGAGVEWFAIAGGVKHAGAQAARRKAQERVRHSDKQGHYFDW